MKKSIIIGIVVIIILILGGILLLKTFDKGRDVSGEGGSNFTGALEKNKIRIGKTYWVGEKNFKKPEPEISEYDIELNKKISFKGNFEIEIIEVNSDSIKIKTNTVMSERKNDRINLLSNQREFVIENGKTKELATPTTDAGDIYIIDINI